MCVVSTVDVLYRRYFVLRGCCLCVSVCVGQVVCCSVCVSSVLFLFRFHCLLRAFLSFRRFDCSQSFLLAEVVLFLLEPVCVLCYEALICLSTCLFVSAAAPRVHWCFLSQLWTYSRISACVTGSSSKRPVWSIT